MDVQRSKSRGRLVIGRLSVIMALRPESCNRKTVDSFGPKVNPASPEPEDKMNLASELSSTASRSKELAYLLNTKKGGLIYLTSIRKIRKKRKNRERETLSRSLFRQRLHHVAGKSHLTSISLAVLAALSEVLNVITATLRSAVIM